MRESVETTAVEVPLDVPPDPVEGVSIEEAGEALEDVLEGEEDPGEEYGEGRDELAEEAVEELKAQQADDEAEDPEENPEADPDAPRYSVKIDGEEVELTMDELKTYASKGGYFTKKTQELAQQRQEAEKLTEQTLKAAESLAQRFEAIDQFLGDRLTPQERWQIEKGYARVRQYQAEKVQAKQAEKLAEEKRLLEASVPEWEDPEVAKRDKAAMVEYAAELGFTPQDLAQVIDHRAMVMLRKAMLYDQLQGPVREQIREKTKRTKVLQPGGRSRATGAGRRSRTRRRLNERLARTGSARDAAAVIETLLDD